MAQHSKRPDAPEVPAYRGVGRPLLEAQVVDAADSLAYDTHDVDDALGVGLITLDDLDERASSGGGPSRRVRQRHRALGAAAVPADRRPRPDRLAGDRPAGAHRDAACAGSASARVDGRARARRAAGRPRPRGAGAEGRSWRSSCASGSTATTACMRMADKGRRIVRQLVRGVLPRIRSCLPERYGRRMPTAAGRAHRLRLPRRHDRPLRPGRVPEAVPAVRALCKIASTNEDSPAAASPDACTGWLASSRPARTASACASPTRPEVRRAA